jgi:enterochelin esterase-like enzyme
MISRAVVLALVGLSLLGGSTLRAQQPNEPYKLGPDSQAQPGVPEGKITQHTWTSRVFEGTTREYSVYVPAQYKGEPAKVMVFQDGHAYVDRKGQFRVPVVLDNLIHKKELPVIVGVFINPGHKEDKAPETPWKANNRSFEYDTLSDQYSKLLLDEILPEVGKTVKLSDKAEDRAICGISSGGICAFTVAWERPDAFHKVLSHVGSFTNIRGGHDYEARIRKTPNKNIRVFLQDGNKDLDNEHGNWWLGNLQMEAALKFKKYDHKFVGGEGGHNGIHGGAILPDSLRWLWRTETTGETK